MRPDGVRDERALLLAKRRLEVAAVAHQERDLDAPHGQHLGQLDPNQPSPDHDGAFGACRRRLEPVEVGPVIEALDTLEVGAGPRRDVRAGAGCDQEAVVPERPAAQRHGLGLGVDAVGAVLDAVDPVLVPEPLLIHPGVLARQDAHVDVHQRRPSVGLARLARDHRDGRLGVGLANVARRRHSGDPVSDDDDVHARGR